MVKDFKAEYPSDILGDAENILFSDAKAKIWMKKPKKISKFDILNYL